MHAGHATGTQGSGATRKYVAWLSRNASVITALLSGVIVLSVITAVLSLQATAVSDSESALDTTSSAIRSEVTRMIASELASLLSLVFIDAMKLAQLHKAHPVTSQTFEDEAQFNEFVQNLFPYVFDDAHIDSLNGKQKYYKDYIGVVGVKANAYVNGFSADGPTFPAECSNTWFGSALRTQDGGAYLSDQQFPNASLPAGSPEIRRLRVLAPPPGSKPNAPYAVGPVITPLPPLICPQAMGSIMVPVLNQQLNSDFGNFAYFGPFDPGIGWGFHFEGSVPLYADADQQNIDGRASAAVSLRGVTDLLKQMLSASGTVMVGGEAMLFSQFGEVWGLTEEPYNTADTTDDDLMTRCVAAQASCPVPLSPADCEVSCLDQLKPGHTKAAVDVTKANFDGDACPTDRWAPEEGFDGRLIDVTPFDFEAHGMPPLGVRWCILTTVPRNNIFESIDQAKDSSTLVFAGAIAGGIVAMLLMAASLVSASLAVRRLEKEKFKAKVERVTKAAKSVTSCSFSVCFCRYTAFAEYGQMIAHEEALQRGDLVCLHTYQDVLSFVSVFPTVFFSHQWLSFTTPDPDNVHYKAILAAAQKVITEHSLVRESLFVWIDYLSIPQRNPVLKGLSISSLGVYASVCKYFVVIAPDAKHQSTSLPCNTDTYQRRGWCRLEQWARIAVGGFKQMYIWVGDGDELDPLENKPKWYNDSIHVFEGDFTNPDDKYALVDTVCGVWAHALRSKSSDSAMLIELVRNNRDSIFPRAYFSNLIGLLEERIDTLEFDDMVVKAEALPKELESLKSEVFKGEEAHIHQVKRGLSLRDVSASSMNGDTLGC